MLESDGELTISINTKQDDSSSQALHQIPPETSQDSLYQHITPQRAEELKTIRQDALNRGALKVENGKVVGSNLTELQWLTVRTPSFKNWFGDWQNLEANACVVRDEHGEPLVVYHGAKKSGFEEFDVNRTIQGKIEGGRYKNVGAFFTPDYQQALDYTHIPPGHKHQYTASELEEIGTEPKPERVIAAFLNIRNLRNYRDGKAGLLSMPRALNSELREQLRQEGYDGVRFRYDTEFVVFDAAQVKSATINNGDFSSTNNNIYK